MSEASNERLSKVLRELNETKAQVVPLMKRIAELERERDHLKSVEFIVMYGIRLEDVEMSAPGPGKPWFGNVMAFGTWLRDSRCKKMWAEWNGAIYLTWDLTVGLMADTPGRVEDLKCRAI